MLTTLLMKCQIPNEDVFRSGIDRHFEGRKETVSEACLPYDYVQKDLRAIVCLEAWKQQGQEKNEKWKFAGSLVDYIGRRKRAETPVRMAGDRNKWHSIFGEVTSASGLVYQHVNVRKHHVKASCRCSSVLYCYCNMCHH